MSLLAACLALVLQGDPLAVIGPGPTDGVRLVLVRHGEAYTNLQPPPPMPEEQRDRLTPKGREQVALLPARIAPLQPRAILSSPAGRAKETAGQLATALGLPAPPVEERVRSMSPKEPFPEIGARVELFAREMARTHAGQTVVVVAHSEVIGSWLMTLRGEKELLTKVPVASITVVDVPASGAPAIRVTALQP